MQSQRWTVESTIDVLPADRLDGLLQGAAICCAPVGTAGPVHSILRAAHHESAVQNDNTGWEVNKVPDRSRFGRCDAQHSGAEKILVLRECAIPGLHRLSCFRVWPRQLHAGDIDSLHVSLTLAGQSPTRTACRSVCRLVAAEEGLASHMVTGTRAWAVDLRFLLIPY